MLSLSKLIDQFHCPDASTSVQDELLEFSRYWASDGNTNVGIESMADWNREIDRFVRLGIPRPSPGGNVGKIFGEDVFNDLFFPKYFQQDNIHHVVFPAIGALRSSQAVATDFALLSLAAYVVPEDSETIIELCWSDGRRVRGFVDFAIWNAAKKFFARITKSKRQRMPGPVCHRCDNRHDCQKWNALSDVLFLTPVDQKNSKTEAHKLWLELVLLKELERKTEERKKLVIGRLTKLAVNGEVDVNGLLRLVVHAQDRTTWDFGQVYSLLQPAGLWSDKFAKIQVGEIKKAMDVFPPAVRQALEKMAKTETTEPSLREAAAGTERAVGDEKTSPFIGLHLRSQKSS
jgi:hypothetical protein